MNLFETICTALTTENELLTNVILLPISFIESILNVLIFTTFLNINLNKDEEKNIFCLFQ